MCMLKSRTEYEWVCSEEGRHEWKKRKFAAADSSVNDLVCNYHFRNEREFLFIRVVEFFLSLFLSRLHIEPFPSRLQLFN